MPSRRSDETFSGSILVIDDFDCWSNPVEPTFLPPCGTSWYGPDPAPEFSE
jgi:hypothetical protein